MKTRHRPSASDAAAPPDLEGLTARLEEAEETLRAIRAGETDALVVQTPDGPRVYTLVTEDHSYRTLVEQMRADETEARLVLAGREVSA